MNYTTTRRAFGHWAQCRTGVCERNARQAWALLAAGVPQATQSARDVGLAARRRKFTPHPRIDQNCVGSFRPFAISWTSPQCNPVSVRYAMAGVSAAASGYRARRGRQTWLRPPSSAPPRRRGPRTHRSPSPIQANRTRRPLPPTSQTRLQRKQLRCHRRHPTQSWRRQRSPQRPGRSSWTARTFQPLSLLMTLPKRWRSRH